MMSTMLANFAKHPDVGKASHVGEPTMVDPAPTNPGDVVRKVANAAGMGGDNKVSVETTDGKIAPNQEAPRSDAEPVATDPAAATAAPAATPDQPAATPDPVSGAAELKPDPNELKPNVDQDANPLPPLQQSNQLENGNASASSSSAAPKSEEMADISSSKKKKKKGISKLNPF